MDASTQLVVENAMGFPQTCQNGFFSERSVNTRRPAVVPPLVDFGVLRIPMAPLMIGLFGIVFRDRFPGERRGPAFRASLGRHGDAAL